MQPPNAVDEIRKLKPHHLLVTVEGDEEPRKVAIPNVRNRWERVATLLDSMKWTHIEARSKDGGTLAMLEPSAAGADSYQSSSTRADDVHTIRERDLLDLVERSNDRAVARCLEGMEVSNRRFEAMFGLLFEGCRGLLEQVTMSTRAVTAQYTQALTLSQSTTGGGGDDGIGGLKPLLDTMRDLKDKKPAAPIAAKAKVAKPAHANGAAK